MAESLIGALEREYDYLRGRQSRDFFLALSPYADALHRKRRVRRVLEQFERETLTALQGYVEAEHEFTEEAKALRRELAERAPEIDNSDMERPDEASHEWIRYDLDSLARFDNLADEDVSIGYSALPKDDADPGHVSRLLGILRGRVNVAEYGENPPPTGAKLRDDLKDLRFRIGNLQERRRRALDRYRQDARTLPGLAYGRLAYFGSDLVREPRILKTDRDLVYWLDQSLREWGSPKRIVEKLVSGQPLKVWEERNVAETEQTLRGELDRLHQELHRQVGSRHGAVGRFLRDEWVVALGSTTIGGVLVAMILVFVFGIGR